jgi:hypothetical protein
MSKAGDSAFREQPKRYLSNHHHHQQHEQQQNGSH